MVNSTNAAPLSANLLSSLVDDNILTVVLTSCCTVQLPVASETIQIYSPNEIWLTSANANSLIVPAIYVMSSSFT